MTEKMIEKLVYAWRQSKEISDGMEKVFGVSLDAMYDVHGNILDALREYVFETGDVEDSEVLRNLQSDAKAAYVAIALRTRHDRAMVSTAPFTPVKQPAPKFFTDEQIERMQNVFGGYVYGRP